MPVHDILGERVEGSQVETTAEMPVLRANEKETQVHVGGRYVRVARMHDQREGRRLKRTPG